MNRVLSVAADRHVHEAALGVLFADPLEGRTIREGLLVELAESRLPHRKQRLLPNGRGVFVAHTLPRASRSDADTSPPALRPFVLTVDDLRARYLPIRIALDLPSGGLLSVDAGLASPPEGPPFVPLYSAPTRDFASSAGALRADLRVSGDLRPAAWALLELYHGAILLAQGAADGRGSALLLFALPPPEDPPLALVSPEPVERAWQVSLRVYWDPALAVDAPPEFNALHRQPERTLQTAQFALHPGEPLVARSAGSSFLLIDP